MLDKLLWRHIPTFPFILFRWVFGSLLFLQLLYDFPRALRNVTQKPHFNPIPLFEVLQISRPTPEVFAMYYMLLLVVLVGLVQGHKGRVSALLASVFFFFVAGVGLSLNKPIGTNYVYHSKNVIALFLFAMCLFPEPLLLSWKKAKEFPTMPRWPLVLLQLILAAAYFGAGYCKLTTSGWEWMNGYTLQAYLYNVYLATDWEPARLLADQFVVCWLVSWILFLVEITFPVIVFSRKLFVGYSFVAILFHSGIYYFMGISFFAYHALAFTCLIIVVSPVFLSTFRSKILHIKNRMPL